MSTPTPPAHGAGSPPPPPAYPPAHGAGSPPPAYPPAYGYHAPPPPLPHPPPLAPNGARLAEFVDRLVARIIDAAILGGVSAVLIIPIYIVALLSILDVGESEVTINGEPVGGPGQLDGDEWVAVLLPLLGVVALLVLLSLLLAYLYEVEMMFRSGQTPGKRIMKLQVIPVDPTQPLTRWLAVKRFLVQHVATVFIPFFQWIDGLWQLWDKPYRQCLHDKFATTLVIKLGP